MSKKAFKAMRAMLRGERFNLSPIKHPILSGAVPVTNYVAPHWSYGKRKG